MTIQTQRNDAGCSIMKHSCEIIDSHTGGEPTRVILSGGPDLGTGSLAERREVFREQFDGFRSGVVNEPRGSDVLVGALLCAPKAQGCAAGVIFFNNVGMLGMCGHGTMGLVVSLAHLGRLGEGVHRIDTPEGVVEAALETPHRVRVANVPSWCYRLDVSVDVPGLGTVVGDISYGGNWFFMIEHSGEGFDARRIPELTAQGAAIRAALNAQGIRGPQGEEIDHIEWTAPSPVAGVHGRNFVLCPGMAYDRSPCGTGTSAKLACLAARGKLNPGQPWRQESIIGSVFDTVYTTGKNGQILPVVTGEAYVCGHGHLLFDQADPFAEGIRT
jgi:4-hydroxyproline epimerase